MLLLLGKEHLPSEVFAKRFNHRHKFQLGYAPWFFSGGLEVIYLLHIAKNENFFGGTDEDFQIVVDDLLRHCGWSDPRRIAAVILKSISPSEEMAPIIQASRDQRERHRTISVYVDIDQSMQVIGHPAEISKEAARSYIDDCRVASAVMDFLMVEKPDVIAFTSSLPRKHRDEARAKGQELVAHVRSSRSADLS